MIGYRLDKPIIQVLTDGGVGDLVCELVAVNYNITHNQHLKFQVWVPDYLWKFAEHVLPKSADVKPFSVTKQEFEQGLTGRTTQWMNNGHTPMRTHPVDYGFHMLADRHIYDLDEKNYLQIRPHDVDIRSLKLPKDYVCITTTSAEPCKALPSQTLNTIIDYVVSRGYTPVFLGKEKSECGYKDFTVKARVIDVDYSKGISLINKTNLLKAAAVIAGARAYVGMDGGLTHVAGCTETTIVAGYSLASPTHLAPIRKGSQTYKFHAVEPDSKLKQRYFQTKHLFYNEDFRTFPGWEKVIESLTADKFIAKLENILL